VDLRAPSGKDRNGKAKPRNGRKTAGAGAAAAGTKGARAPKPPRSGKGKAPVVVIIRNAKGKKLSTTKLSGTMQIGRDESCEIRPDDSYLSQFHAKLYANDGVWFVEDLGSTNGTYLNQNRLTGPVEIHAGDTLRVGEITMELRR
jgi:pSer/pThr/pTyr-binding forkhead associated (FHA) protein